MERAISIQCDDDDEDDGDDDTKCCDVGSADQEAVEKNIKKDVQSSFFLALSKWNL